MPDPNTLERVTLFTTPPIHYPLARRTAEGQEQTLHASVVVEIASVSTPLLRQTMYPTMEATRYWDLELPSAIAKRFSEFFRRTLVRGTFPRYECHSLPDFLYGGANNIRLGSTTDGVVVLGPPLDDHQLEAGRPYAIADQRPAATHSFLSLGDIHPGFSVSILEGDGPLVVSTNAETSIAFGGIDIRPRLYEATGDLALRHYLQPTRRTS